MSILVLLGFGLMTVSWTFSNPPFHAPDELWHYYRAVGIGAGDLIGDPAPYDKPGYSQAKLDWIRQDVREVTVPAGLTPYGVGCTAFSPEIPANCTDEITSAPDEMKRITIIGSRHPMPYVLSGLLMVQADDAVSALFLARIGNAIGFLALLAVAVWLTLGLEERQPWAFTGLLLAVTPLAVFSGGVLNPSAIEIAASFALFAGLAGIALSEETRWSDTLLTVVAAFVLGFSRSASIIFLASAWLLIGVAFARKERKALLDWVAVAAGTIAGSTASFLWSRAFAPSAVLDFSDFFSSIVHSLSRLGMILEQAIGMFGWLDAPMPKMATIFWVSAALLLCSWALLVGTRRERLALGLALVGVMLGPAFLDVVLIRPTGFNLQGRHVLPFLGTVPMLAALILGSNREVIKGRDLNMLTPTIAAFVASIHVVGWLSNARRHAVGNQGPIMFFGHSKWVPPTGWTLWFALMLVGAALLIVAGLQVQAMHKHASTADEHGDANLGRGREP